MDGTSALIMIFSIGFLEFRTPISMKFNLYGLHFDSTCLKRLKFIIHRKVSNQTLKTFFSEIMNWTYFSEFTKAQFKSSVGLTTFLEYTQSPVYHNNPKTALNKELQDVYYFLIYIS